MKTFSNDWTRVHEAMVANIAEKEKLIKRLIGENIELVEVCRAVLLWRREIETHEREPKLGLDEVLRLCRDVIAKNEGRG